MMRCFIFLLLLPALLSQSCIAWVCPTLQPFTTTFISRKKLLSTILAISQAPYISGAEQSWDDVQSKERLANANVAADSLTYLIHTGRAIKMIKRCVAIEGLSVSDGWTPQATEAFSLAVEAVVRANPILTGQLIEEKTSPWPWAQPSTLKVIPGVFRPESHSFLTTVNPPANLTSPAQVIKEEINEAASAKEIFHHVHSHIAPCLLGKAEFSYDQIKNASPLFEAKIMDFGDGYAAHSIKMSHALGDGTTFFQIIKQLSSYMNGHEPQPINWDNPLKASHEIYPETFSKQDYDRSYGGPFGWGVFKNIRTLGKRKCEYLLLSKDKIAKKKRELHESTGNARISSNDVVMSVICQMCGSSDIFAFDRSVRGIKDGVDKLDAGNFFWEIPFDREEGAANPSVIRNILTSETGTYYDTDEVPLLPSLSGRVGRITSLASITQKTTFPGSKAICQFPSASFISDLPLDVAVIFRFNEDHFGLMHNFRRVTPSPLLSEIIA